MSAIPKARDKRARTLYATVRNLEQLTVTGASAEHLLAMKLEAGRAADETDIAALVKLLGLRSIEEGVEIHRRLFPESRKDTRSLMADALGAQAKP